MRKFGSVKIALVLAGAFLFLALFPQDARAQFTQVTGTVVDPNGIPYANGTLSAVLVPGSSTGYRLSGQPYAGQIGPVTLDGNGHFSANFGDVTLITPGSPQWLITVNSNPGGIPAPLGTGGQTFTYTSTGTIISGSSPVNISTQLNALAPKLTNFAAGGGTIVSCSTTGGVAYENGTPENLTCGPNLIWDAVNNNLWGKTIVSGGTNGTDPLAAPYPAPFNAYDFETAAGSQAANFATGTNAAGMSALAANIVANAGFGASPSNTVDEAIGLEIEAQSNTSATTTVLLGIEMNNSTASTGTVTTSTDILFDTPPYVSAVTQQNGLDFQDQCMAFTVAATNCNAILIEPQTAPGIAINVQGGPVLLGSDGVYAAVLQLASVAGVAHTVLSSVATTTNTFDFPATVLTTNTFGKCVTATTVCTFTQSLLTDNGTTLSYAGSGGIAVPSNGVNAGGVAFIGNTTIPSSLPASNYVGFIGPNSASFTSYYGQLSATAPAGNYLTCAAPVSTISACTWSTPAGTGANTALSNLAAVAINAALLPGPTNSIALGSASEYWSNAFLTAEQCGIAGTTSCVITGAGSTSGTATITWPAVAGTATNPIALSNNLTVPAASSSGYGFAGTTIANLGVAYNGGALLLNGGSGGTALASSSLGGLIAYPNIGFDFYSSGFAIDTGLSRDAAGVVDVGTGAVGNIAGKMRGALFVSNGGTGCANGNFALSAGWGSTASVSGAEGFSQTCQITITSSGTGQATGATVTWTLPTAIGAATTVCTANLVGGTITGLSGTGILFNNTTLSSTAPVFTFAGLPVTALTTIVVFRCGP